MVVYTVRRRKVAEMKHGETTAHNNDGQGCARTTGDQRRLLSTLLSSQPQRTSTTNLNREPWAVSSYYKNEQQLSLEDKLHYHANNNERVFHHNPAPLSFQAPVLPGLGTRQRSASPNVLPVSSHPF